MRQSLYLPDSMIFQRLLPNLFALGRKFINQPLFVFPVFDQASERLFWQERQQEFQQALKFAIAVGIAGFLSFIGIKILTQNLPLSAIPARLIIVLALIGLWLHLHHGTLSVSKIRCIAKISVLMASINVMATLLITAAPQDYTECWTTFLAIYFFTYGQLYLRKTEALLFGWLSLLALIICGYWIGVSAHELATSLLILSIVNTFGYLTRCQLEAYSRNAFKDRRQAESATNAKTLYLCQLSHNLRQYVQTISCYSSVLENEMLHSNDTLFLPTTQKLGNAVDELNSAFNHILDIAHLESGKQLPSLSQVNLNLLFDSLETQFAPLAIKRGIRLKFLRRPHPPYNVISDPHILQQILSNLIDNAIKYTRRGWVLVAAIKINPAQVKVHVRDTGLGISDDMQAHIFEAFYRGGKRQCDGNIDGLGIGLAYTLKASEHLPEHHLTYQSRINQGSDFMLTLPSGASQQEKNHSATQQQFIAGNYILAVDDDTELLSALTAQLQSWGCLVQHATSNSETLACLSDALRPPDLLITDFLLENGETAHDIITSVQNDCGPVPTLVLSAHAISDADKHKLPTHTLILRKPANAALLLAAINSAMAKFKALN